MWGWSEIVFAHFHYMRHFSPELYINAEAAVERFPRLGSQTDGELALKHENGRSWGIWEREKFEDEWRGDLVSLSISVTSK